MRWDLMLFKLDPSVKTPADLTDEKTLPMGTLDELRALITAQFPGIDWQPATNGVFFGSALSFEFSLPDGAKTAHFFSITAHGKGDILTPLRPLTTHHGWTIFDIGANEFINPDNAATHSSKPPADK